MGLQLLNVFLIGILVIHFIDADDIVPEPEIKPQEIKPQSAPCASGSSFDCANCTTRAVCDSEQKMLLAMKCEKDAPYCNSGVCTTVIPETGCPAEASPLCPAPGTFPSINGCRKYIKCDAGKSATEYQCPQSLVYDPKTKACKRRVWNTDCPLIRCDSTRNNFVVYPLDKRLYFYCGTSSNDIKLLQCPKEKEFNPTTVICENICKEASYIAAPDPKKYFMCVKNGNEYDKFLHECPPGHQFDETAFECTAPTPK